MDSPVKELPRLMKKLRDIQQKIKHIRSQGNNWDISEVEQLCQEVKITTDEVQAVLAAIGL